MNSIFANPQEAVMWREAAEAKWFGKGKPFGREEFDMMLGHCMVHSNPTPSPILLSQSSHNKLIFGNYQGNMRLAHLSLPRRTNNRLPQRQNNTQHPPLRTLVQIHVRNSNGNSRRFLLLR